MNRPKWLREIRELLRSDVFCQWYERYRELRQGIAACRERCDELTVERSITAFRAELVQRAANDAVYRAGERQDRATRATAEYAAIENDSLQVLSAYEQQREHALAIRQELDGREGPFEDLRHQVVELRAEIEAMQKSDASAEQVDVASFRLAYRERELASALHQLEPLRAKLTREEQRQAQLWDKEESTWYAAFRANLARSEYGYQARRLKRDAEHLFAHASAAREHVARLNTDASGETQHLAELQATFEHHTSDVEALFGCTLVEEFLYWAKQEDLHGVYCVPLVDEEKLFNIPVSALHLYQIDSERGLDLLEPIAEGGTSNDDDPRLDAFFLCRPGVGTGHGSALAEVRHG